MKLGLWILVSSLAHCKLAVASDVATQTGPCALADVGSNGACGLRQPVGFCATDGGCASTRRPARSVLCAGVVAAQDRLFQMEV
jgi:hypothetical protein